MEEIKQVIVVRTDIKMGIGKLASQVAHASLSSYLETKKVDEEMAKAWIEEGQKKIVLKASSEETLEKLKNAFDFLHIPNALISDAGLTQIEPGTITALGIGPWKASEIDKITGNMKLL
ncbi:MAG: peptidyl-tRNA hydrolase Pth2 [Candidatus Micrarchaeaceae archaeon]